MGCELTLYLATSCSIVTEDACDKVKVVSGRQLIGNPGSLLLPCLVGPTGSRSPQAGGEAGQALCPWRDPVPVLGVGTWSLQTAARRFPSTKPKDRTQNRSRLTTSRPCARRAVWPANLQPSGAAVLRLEGVNDGANE